MTLIKRIALASLAAVFSAAAAPSHAFMVAADVVETTEGAVDMTKAVDALREELKAGQTKCNEMLGKIDAAIEQIDAALDAGVADETKYLGLRDELVELRLTLPCMANELTAAGDLPMDGAPVDGILVDGPMLGDGTMVEEGGFINSGMGSVGGPQMAVGGSGGSGGAGASGPGLGGLLGIGGLATAIALGVDDDEPGDNASPSD